MVPSAHIIDPVDERTFLAADVGGTHARIGLAHRGANGSIHITDYTTYLDADYADLGEILRTFMATHPPQTRRCVLACAGYVIDGVVVNDNLPWTVEVEPLRHALGLDELALINDFEALAHAAPHIETSATTLLSTCSHGTAGGPVVMLGPGTGLGSAVYVPDARRPLVLATETGQANLGPGNALETELLRIMARNNPYVPYEYVLSGPGLLHLYAALGHFLGQPTPLDDPRAITRHAASGEDTLARKTLDAFCALLGCFASNLAMMYNASGGVYLAGGIVPHIREAIMCSDFMVRFLAKGQNRAFLERVPVWLIQHGQLGVAGAASWYLDDYRQAGAIVPSADREAMPPQGRREAEANHRNGQQ